jgi:competence ComEA-like helix-hairpin-helix protein
MRNSEFIKRLKSSFSFLIPNSALRVPHPMRYFSLGQQKILIVLAVFIFALLYFKFYFHRSLPPEETYQEVVVEILGEVQKPGIYIFKTPPILIEAVEKAGGLKENVLLDRGVFSEIMETGALINVIRETDVIPPYPPLAKGGEGGILKKGGSGGISPNIIKIKLGRMEAPKLLAFSIPLDLNRVSVEDLCLIPGIGESLAKEIVSYRERRKGFRSVEELRNVKGIGERKWKEFTEFFMVR